MPRRTQDTARWLLAFEYRGFTFFALPFQVILLTHNSTTLQSYNPNSKLVWASPVSLAATQGIDLSFFSSSYLDVSIRQVFFSVTMYSLQDEQCLNCPGFPIRIPPVHRLIRLPEAFRRFSRPSSAISAKSSSACP